jgi:hypothetical protein
MPTNTISQIIEIIMMYENLYSTILLYADDLALAAESEKQLMEKIKRWKDGMEEKGLRVNVGKLVRLGL